MHPQLNPRFSLPLAVTFALASLAACFLVGIRLGQYLFDRVTGGHP